MTILARPPDQPRAAGHTTPFWKEQIQQTLFANVLSRRAKHYQHVTRLPLEDSRVTHQRYCEIINKVKTHVGICFLTGCVVLPTSIAIAVAHGDKVMLLRNPAYLKQTMSSRGMLAVMDSGNLQFTDVAEDATTYWQRFV